MNDVQFEGGAKKPTLQDLLIVRCVMLPVTLLSGSKKPEPSAANSNDEDNKAPAAGPSKREMKKMAKQNKNK